MAGTKICLGCGKDFVPQKKKPGPKYCSRDCYRTRDINGRFWSFVDKNGPVPAHNPSLGQCWIWTGSLTDRGYGNFVRSRRTKGPRPVRAHRFAWEMKHGPIPKSMEVCHGCDNPPCVRDEHLFLGSAKQNTEDMCKKGRHYHGERQHLAKLTEKDVLEIRALRLDGKELRALAARYGVSDVCLRNVIKGRTWRHLLPPGTH